MRKITLIAGLLLLLPHCAPEPSVPETRVAISLPPNTYASLEVEWAERPTWEETDGVSPKVHPLNLSRKYEKSGVFLELGAEEGIALESGQPGRVLRVINNGETVQRVATIDFTLYLLQQAKDPQGNWQIVEDMQSIICTLSYSDVALEPMTFWEFIAPRYEGNYKTTMRFVLAMGDGHNVYSDEFSGKVKRGYFRNDPERRTRMPEPKHISTPYIIR